MTDILSLERFHLVGIKGVAMTSLALILCDLGKTVTGSDVDISFQTDSLLQARQILVYPQFAKNHVKSAQVVIYSASHLARENLEVIEALKQKKTVLVLPEIIGYLTKLKQNIAVSGCHGKTTTTALISFVMEKMDLKPSFFVGSAGFMNLASGKWSSGKMFITEADEYLADFTQNRRSKFLYFHPSQIICTNIDYDHPDFFKNLEEIQQAFLSFFKKLSPTGQLIINGDDENLLLLAKKSQRPFVSYGFSAHNHYRIIPNQSGFQIFQKNRQLAEIRPLLSGRHNMLNICAAFILIKGLKLNLKQAVSYIEQFTGAKRRLELIAKIGPNFLIDDYAHHPAEIAASLSSIKQQYPDHQIALCFQLHTYTRTKKLLPDFINILSTVDYLGLLPIFASAREIVDPQFSEQVVLAGLPKKQLHQQLSTLGQWQTLVNRTQALGHKWVYVTMGAGDVYQQIPLLTKLLHEHLK